jgi:SAM-dependent methyltransferase
MESDERRSRAAAFSGVAETYARHRPDYPIEAVKWLTGESSQRVLELGAGTGKLTAKLTELKHDVVATDPSAAMLAELAAAAPGAHITRSVAEAIPLATSSVDIAVAAQCLHLFDQSRAMPEIARVLRPGGSLVITSNVGDRRIPWVKKVYALVGAAATAQDDFDPFAESDVFELADQIVIRHWQEFRRDKLVGFVASTSTVASLDPAEREQRLVAAEELYDSYGRGPDGLLMPWLTHCYRGRVAGLVSHVRSPDDEPTQMITGADLDDGLLIDFK